MPEEPNVSIKKALLPVLAPVEQAAMPTTEFAKLCEFLAPPMLSVVKMKNACQQANASVYPHFLPTFKTETDVEVRATDSGAV